MICIFVSKIPSLRNNAIESKHILGKIVFMGEMFLWLDCGRCQPGMGCDSNTQPFVLTPSLLSYSSINITKSSVCT